MDKTVARYGLTSIFSTYKYRVGLGVYTIPSN
jgi:hypothetical protein